ncbi:MAG: M20 family metallopeptidase [bacterium]|nr:M20 family metallopeptidase [bacterium]
MDAIEYLKELVEIPSTFPNEAKIGKYCRGKLESLGFSIQVFELEPGRPNFVATRGENPSLAFFGHMDTVPVYGEWETDPHQLVEKDGKLYGLGAGDMKGGIAAFFSALQRTSDPVMVILTSDEENNSGGSHLLSRHPGLFQGIKLMLASEPTEHGNEEGSILLGRRGRAVYQVNVSGVSAHGAHVDRGINAIEKASELVLSLKNFPLKTGTEIGNQSLFVREISGANTSLSIPETASFQIDMHLVTGQNDEGERVRLEQFLQQAYPECTVEIFDRGHPYNMPFYTPPETPGVGLVQKIVQDVVGRTSWSHGESVADENVFAQFFPAISYGPVSRNYHSANEYATKDSILRCEQIYERILREW